MACNGLKCHDVIVEHDTRTPDVETASEGYALRFRGPVGRWLLSAQEDGVRTLLQPHAAEVLNVFEVGGGHGQLTELFLSSGHRITVQGSSRGALARLERLRSLHPGQLRFVVSRFWSLPFADRSFDLVVGVRLLAHVEEWRELLEEMIRVSRRYVIVDFPPLSSSNILTPLLFWAKRLVEGDTRPYFCYWPRTLKSYFRSRGFEPIAVYRQFAVPMGLHRAIGRAAVSRRVESALRGSGLTRAIGSPALLMAERNGAGG
jgi:hypothetical protein